MITLKAIVPKKNKIVSSIVFANRIKKELNKSAKDIKIQYEKTVRGWKRKPDFDSKINYNFFGGWSLNVYPSGKHAMQYNWVDLGTRKHPITPKNAKALVFFRGFTPATTPRKIGSGIYKYYPPKVVAQRVFQGITAREFSETISEQYQSTFVNRMNYAFKQTAESFEE